MKRYLINLLVILSLAVIAPGCYTVIWTPDEEFPTERDYEYQGYYPDNYYGDYYFFYDYPWWLTITPPDYTGSDNPGTERKKETTRTRNTDGGRSTTDRRNPDSGNTNGNIIQTQSPTRDRSSDNNNSNNNDSGTTTTSSSNDNSGSSSTETDRSRSSSDNSGSGSSRNNDGGRNSGGKR